jgi:DNA-binding NarL/FixJ family response regulator
MDRRTDCPIGSRVVLVDDHPIVRAGIAQLLESQNAHTVVAECGGIDEAMDAVAAHAPDLVIVDVRLGDEDGLELVKRLVARDPEIRILVLSMHDEKLFAERSMRAGARGYVMKNEDPAQLMHAVREVLAGRHSVSPQVQATLLQQSFTRSKSGAHGMDGLTDRELDVFSLIGHGKENRDIATVLNLSVRTVQTYRDRIKTKLGVEGRGELLQRAVLWAHAQDASSETDASD